MELFAFNGFFQLNSIVNLSGSIFGLVFCDTDLLTVNKSLDSFVLLDKYHPSLSIYISNLPFNLFTTSVKLITVE